MFGKKWRKGKESLKPEKTEEEKEAERIKLKSNLKFYGDLLFKWMSIIAIALVVAHLLLYHVVGYTEMGTHWYLVNGSLIFFKGAVFFLVAMKEWPEGRVKTTIFIVFMNIFLYLRMGHYVMDTPYLSALAALMIIGYGLNLKSFDSILGLGFGLGLLVLSAYYDMMYKAFMMVSGDILILKAGFLFYLIFHLLCFSGIIFYYNKLNGKSYKDLRIIKEENEKINVKELVFNKENAFLVMFALSALYYAFY